MPAIPKPHRIAVLVPEVKLDGPDTAYEREAAALLWTACIELCQRHPRLSVFDADATPMLPQDGHFAPQHAGRGGRPTDAFYAPTRRDEVIWLELGLGAKPGIVRLQAIGRAGAHETFDALGRSTGEQIQQVLAAWTQARGLGPFTRKLEAVTADEILAVVRVVGPTLVEQARTWSLPVAAQPTWTLQVDEDDLDEEGGDTNTMLASQLEQVLAPAGDDDRRRSLARPLVNRLPLAFRAPALRLLELALREDLGGDLLAIDPDHPQARFARFERAAPHGKDVGLLRAIIASAPGWARPYAELEPGAGAAVTELESHAAAGMAAVCRPAALEALETAAARLAEAGRVDEGLRLIERAVSLHAEDPRAHLALLRLHEHADRPGAWLERALQTAREHGCPLDPDIPWYPDQIHVDLRASSALLAVGRLAEAIALRASRLDGREAAWPNQTRVLASWRTEPQLAAEAYAREGAARGDVARVLVGFEHAVPRDASELAAFLDALVALGGEDEAPLAWGHLGLGLGLGSSAGARLGACRALTAAGEHRRALEELWRVELTDPGRDEQVAIARAALVMSGTPIEVIEAALGERIAIGAPTLARRMARVIADFVPAAANSGLVARALGKVTPVDFDAACLGGFSAETRGRRQIDALFDELGALRKGSPSGFDIADELERGDRLVERWLDVVISAAAGGERAPLVQAAAYTAAQALARYLAATTFPPTTLAGALRAVAAEALALVRVHRHALGDREASALLGALDPVLRRVDRWVGSTWLAMVERSLGIDERSAGDVVGFAKEYPTVATRILGPEDTAVLAWSIARLHRERPAGWAAKVAAQASRLALHTGTGALDEWADAVAAQLVARELEADDAIDALHTASYLGDGVTTGPCVHTARVLFAAGRAPAALTVLLRATGPVDAAALREAWSRAAVDVPFEVDEALAGATVALSAGDPSRAEKLARWAVAAAPGNVEARRALGIALAQQGKVIDALEHLPRGTGARALEILAGVLVLGGKLGAAVAVQSYASRWYTRADQWLALARTATDAHDRVCAARAYARAKELDPAVEVLVELPPSPRDPIYAQLEAGDHAGAAARLADPSWRVRRAALRAACVRLPSENHVDVTARARTAATAVLADTTGTMDREALLARCLALQIREQAYFARDPAPRLGERMTREAFGAALRARAGADADADADAVAPVAPIFVDRVVVPGSKVARASDYVALLRDLAALAPREALAQFDLDAPGYLEVARAWVTALDADPTLAATIATGLARTR